MQSTTGNVIEKEDTKNKKTENHIKQDSEKEKIARALNFLELSDVNEIAKKHVDIVTQFLLSRGLTQEEINKTFKILCEDKQPEFTVSEIKPSSNRVFSALKKILLIAGYLAAGYYWAKAFIPKIDPDSKEEIEEMKCEVNSLRSKIDGVNSKTISIDNHISELSNEMTSLKGLWLSRDGFSDLEKHKKGNLPSWQINNEKINTVNTE